MPTPPKRPSRPHVPQPAPQQSPRERMREAVKAVVDEKVAQRESDRRHTIASKKKADRKEGRRRWQIVALVIAFAASLVYAIPSWREPFDAPTGAEAVRNARQTLVFAASLVNGYVATRGAPPQLLSDVGVELPGVHYSLLDGTWTLSMRVDEQLITYRSGDDPDRFLAGQ